MSAPSDGELRAALLHVDAAAASLRIAVHYLGPRFYCTLPGNCPGTALQVLQGQLNKLRATPAPEVANGR